MSGQIISPDLLNKIQSLFGMRIQHKRDTTIAWEASTTPLLEGEIGINISNGKFKIGDGRRLWKELPYAAVSPEDVQRLMTFKESVDLLPTSGMSIGDVYNLKSEGVNYVWVGKEEDYDNIVNDNEYNSNNNDGWEKLDSLITIDNLMPDFDINTAADNNSNLTKNPVSEFAVYKFIYDYFRDKNMIQKITKNTNLFFLDVGIYQFTEDFQVWYTNDKSRMLSCPLLLILDNSPASQSTYTIRWIMIGQGYDPETLYICWKYRGPINSSNPDTIHKNWTILNTDIITDKDNLSENSEIKQLVDQSVIKALFDDIVNKIGNWSETFGTNTITNNINILVQTIDALMTRVISSDITDLNNFYLTSSSTEQSAMAFFQHNASNSPAIHDGIIFVTNENGIYYQLILSPYDGKIFFRHGLYELETATVNWSNWNDKFDNIKSIIGSSFNTTNTVETAINTLNETSIKTTQDSTFNDTSNIINGIYKADSLLVWTEYNIDENTNEIIYTKGIPLIDPYIILENGHQLVIGMDATSKQKYLCSRYNSDIDGDFSQIPWSIMEIGSTITDINDLTLQDNKNIQRIVNQSLIKQIYDELKSYHLNGKSSNHPIDLRAGTVPGAIYVQRILDQTYTIGTFYYKINKEYWNTIFGKDTDINEPWPNITVDNFPTTRTFRLDVEDYYSGAENINVTNVCQKLSIGPNTYCRVHYITDLSGNLVDTWSSWTLISGINTIAINNEEVSE